MAKVINVKKRIVAIVVAGLISVGVLGATGTAVFADNSRAIDGCSVTSQTPYQGPDSIMITSFGVAGYCNVASWRALTVELHHQVGWWSPVIASNTDFGSKTGYSQVLHSCGVSGPPAVYFTDTIFSGVRLGSGNSGWIVNRCQG